MHPTTERLLALTDADPTQFSNFSSKVAGLQVPTTTPGKKILH